MESNTLIPIKNVYYMLSYAFQVLRESGYKRLSTEKFKNTGDLCAAILIKGISNQLKRGLNKDYISKSDTLSSLKGKLNISESIKQNTIIKNQMVCEYDEFSENSYLNRVIKTTANLLIRSDIDISRKKQLKQLLVYFGEVEYLRPNDINWKMQYNRNNQTYQMLISICYLVIKGLLQSSSTGASKLMDFFDEQRMCRLYEKFILEYYRVEHPELKADPLKVPWVLADEDLSSLLPQMQTDITLRNKKENKILIIDAKYYSRNTDKHYGKNVLHSNNLYQIFTYVKNMEAQKKSDDIIISGLLLYAKTTAIVQPDARFHMSGNEICVDNLDLSQEFDDIAKHLDKIAESFV